MAISGGTLRLIFALTLTAIPAMADLVSVDAWSAGDREIVRDTATGLDWLALTVTNDQSINSINAGFGNLLADGFELASLAQVLTLLSNAGAVGGGYGIENDPSAQTIANAKSFLSLFGCTECVFFGLSPAEFLNSVGTVGSGGRVLSPANGLRFGGADLNSATDFCPGPGPLCGEETAFLGVEGVDQAYPPFALEQSQWGDGVFLTRETPSSDTLPPGTDPTPQFPAPTPVSTPEPTFLSLLPIILTALLCRSLPPGLCTGMPAVFRYVAAFSRRLCVEIG